MLGHRETAAGTCAVRPVAAVILAPLLAFALASCGVKGPPERPSGGRGAPGARVPQARTILGAETTTEAPAAPVVAPKPERRFILDGLL